MARSDNRILADPKQEKFMTLYRPVARDIERYVMNLTRNRVDAKDVINETVMLAFERIDTLKEEKAFLSWMFSIAHRAWVHMKRKNTRTLACLPEDLDLLSSPSRSPEMELEITFLYAAMDRLEEKMREALILAEIFEFSHKEIADVQNTTVSNVKIRVFRAKRILAKRMGSTAFERKKSARQSAGSVATMDQSMSDEDYNSSDEFSLVSGNGAAL